MLKRIEKAVKSFLYIFIKLIFRNKQHTLPINHSNVKKILILRYDVIGDMIVTMPAIDLLKRNLAQSEIHVVCSESNFSVIKNDNRISKIFILEKNLLKRIKQLLRIRKEQYDLVFAFVFNRTTSAGFIANLAANKNTPKINIHNNGREKMYSTFFNVLIDIYGYRNNFTMAELLVIIVCKTFAWKEPVTPILINLQLSQKNLDFADNFIKQNKLDKYSILNISSAKNNRQLSAKKNIELIKRMFEKDNKTKLVITSLPKEIEKARLIKSFFAERIELCPVTYDILDIAAVISKSELVITPDTSVTHISAAFCKPVVLLNSSLGDGIREWAPLGSKSIIVSTEDRKALEFIDINEVAEAFFKLKSIV